jgi:hypothetical protein
MHRVYHDLQPPGSHYPAYVRLGLTPSWEITLEIDSRRDFGTARRRPSPAEFKAIFAETCEAYPDCVGFVALPMELSQRLCDGNCHESVAGAGAD